MTTEKLNEKVTDLQAPLKELHKFFNRANKSLFKNKLPKVVITIQSKGKTNSLGWFTVNKQWKINNNEHLHEINISAEALNRDYLLILQTLLHEMIHLYCSINGITEVSRGGTYHNGKFKQTAEMFGMEYTHEKADPKIGYSAVTLTERTKEMFKTWPINPEAFTLARFETGLAPDKNGKVSGKKGPISYKWVCPSCGDTVRSTKPSVKMACVNDLGGKKEPCMKMFELQ